MEKMEEERKEKQHWANEEPIMRICQVFMKCLLDVRFYALPRWAMMSEALTLEEDTDYQGGWHINSEPHWRAMSATKCWDWFSIFFCSWLIVPAGHFHRERPGEVPGRQPPWSKDVASLPRWHLWRPVLIRIHKVWAFIKKSVSLLYNHISDSILTDDTYRDKTKLFWGCGLQFWGRLCGWNGKIFLDIQHQLRAEGPGRLDSIHGKALRLWHGEVTVQ